MTDILPDVVGGGGLHYESTPVFVVNGLGYSAPLSAENYLNAAYFPGNAFFASTGTQAIAVGERLKVRIENPAGSGVALDLVYRRFGNDRSGADALLERKVARGLAPLVSPNSSTVLRLNPDPNIALTGQALVTWTADNSATISGATVGAPMSLNGAPEIIGIFSGIYPGDSLTYEVAGANGTTSDPARVEVAYGWVERPWSPE